MRRPRRGPDPTSLIRKVTAVAADRQPKASPPAYKLGDLVATREAYGMALAAATPTRASSRSMPTSRIPRSAIASKRRTDRYENFIAEQVMVGAGPAARGAIPHPSTFACFLTRAADSSAWHQQRRDRRGRTPACRSAGRAVADGAQIRDDARTELHRLLSVRRGQHRRLMALMHDHPCPPTCARAGRRRRSSTRTTRRSPSAASGPARGRQRRGHGDRLRRHGVRSAESYDQLREACTMIRVIDLSVSPVDRALIAAGKATKADHGRITTRRAVSATRSTKQSPAKAHRPPPRRSRDPRSGKPEEPLERFDSAAISRLFGCDRPPPLPYSYRPALAPALDRCVCAHRLELGLLLRRQNLKTSVGCARATAKSASTAAASALF